MSPYEQRLVNIIADINRRTGNPARLTAILANLGDVSPRTVRYHLHNIEQKSAITRLTPKTGYILPAFV